jgi:hypothetical protein
VDVRVGRRDGCVPGEGGDHVDRPAVEATSGAVDVERADAVLLHRQPDGEHVGHAVPERRPRELGVDGAVRRVGDRDRGPGQRGLDAGSEARFVLALVEVGRERSGEDDRDRPSAVEHRHRDLDRPGDGLPRQVGDPPERAVQRLRGEHDPEACSYAFAAGSQPWPPEARRVRPTEL